MGPFRSPGPTNRYLNNLTGGTDPRREVQLLFRSMLREMRNLGLKPNGRYEPRIRRDGWAPRKTPPN